MTPALIGKLLWLNSTSICTITAVDSDVSQEIFIKKKTYMYKLIISLMGNCRSSPLMTVPDAIDYAYVYMYAIYIYIYVLCINNILHIKYTIIVHPTDSN